MTDFWNIEKGISENCKSILCAFEYFFKFITQASKTFYLLLSIYVSAVG